jgi:S1-C subfamily serine protease
MEDKIHADVVGFDKQNDLAVIRLKMLPRIDCIDSIGIEIPMR